MKYKLSLVSELANLLVLQDTKISDPSINDEVMIEEFFIVEV
tara:strand:- start:58603 stop:58728 length:126 start_codon:yes stop_codon:yes gene_type:complete